MGIAPNSVANDKMNSLTGENQEFRKAEFNRVSQLATGNPRIYDTDRPRCIFMRWACLVWAQHSATTDGHQASHAGGATHCTTGTVLVVATSIHVLTTRTRTHTHISDVSGHAEKCFK